MGKTSIIDIYNKYYSPTSSTTQNTPKMDFLAFLGLASIDPTAFDEKPKFMGQPLINCINYGFLEKDYIEFYLSTIRKGKYLQWLIAQRNWIFEDMRYSDVYEALFWFDYNKQYLPNSDIYAFSAQQLIDFYHENNSIDLRAQHELQKAEEKGGELVYFDDDWAIVIPRTFEASCYFGQFTKWCTTERKDTSYYYNYMKKGPLFISIDRKSSHKYQFYFVPGEFDFRNEVDDAVFPWDVDMPENAKNFFREVGGIKGYTTDQLNAFLANGKKPEEVFDKVGPVKSGYRLVKIDMRYNYLDVATNQLVGRQWYFFAQDFYYGKAKVWIQRYTHNFLKRDLTYAFTEHCTEYKEDAWKYPDYYENNPEGKEQRTDSSN